MDQNVNNKISLKEKLLTFYNSNKLKIYSLIIVLLTILITIIFLKIDNKKQNNLTAEKYIQAGLYLTSKEKEKSIELYEEIILNKNKFYSILALNTVLEKELILDKKKILYYFTTVEEINLSKELKDLISFKKALYLIKNLEAAEGKKILKDLVDQNSKLKNLSKEILAN